MSNLTILTILTLLSAVFIIILFTTALLSDNYCGAQRFDAKIKISSFTISEISVFIWTTYTTTHFLGQLIGITKSKMFKIKFWVGCGLHTLPQKTCTKLKQTCTATNAQESAPRCQESACLVPVLQLLQRISRISKANSPGHALSLL